MARQLFIGLITEGPTDVRFLQSVVERTFIDVAFECENDLEPYVKCLTVEKVRLSFNEYVEKASRRGMEEMGMDILCVHTDADSKDTKRAYAEKINPARRSTLNICVLYFLQIVPFRFCQVSRAVWNPAIGSFVKFT